MKVESLVIAEQHAAVNTFPGLVHTARHIMGVGFTRRSSVRSRPAPPEILAETRQGQRLSGLSRPFVSQEAGGHLVDALAIRGDEGRGTLR
eukprot:s1_g2141.t1